MPHLLDYLLGPDTTLRDLLLAAVDVALVAYVVYRVLRVIRGTRAVAVLAGLFLIGLAYLGAQWAGLETLSWLLGHFLSYSFIFGVIVLFQADIRRALAELGRSSRLLAALSRDDRVAQRGAVDAVVKAAVELAGRRHGALLVLERSAELGDVADSGVRLDAALGPELLLSIFQPQSPIHDGAVVIQGGRVAAAGCLLPLSVAAAPQELGTRHRAALGLAEEVDAAVVVVSEERGEISVALEGALHRGLDEKALRALLYALFVTPGRHGPGGRSGRQVRPTPTPAPARREEPHAAV